MTTTVGAWDILRASRWKPPGSATRPAGRKLTYQTALEQAEELFTAAGQVSPKARPVLVFYGLSQAGRAIAAAACKAYREEWKLDSHGIHAVDQPGPLPDVKLRTGASGSSGSFVRVSELLGSPVWEHADVPFAELWDYLPNNATPSQALTDDHTSRRMPLEVMPFNHPQPHPYASGLVTGLPERLIDDPQPGKALDDYLSAYPGARDYKEYLRTQRAPLDATAHLTPREVPHFTIDSDERVSLQMHWSASDGTNLPPFVRDDYVLSLAKRHAGSAYFFPEISSAGARIAPLMAWWAVLFSLSMIARYNPSTWTQHLDINTSRYAYPVERLLDDALLTVPSLIAEAIEQVSQPSAPELPGRP
jgi:hypothetical protein